MPLAQKEQLLPTLRIVPSGFTGVGVASLKNVSYGDTYTA